jgi:hypothetical protein
MAMNRNRRKAKKPNKKLLYSVARPAAPVVEPRNCPWLVTAKADLAAFRELYEAARRYARATDRWCEVQPGELQFHFADVLAARSFARLCLEKKFHLTFRDKRKQGALEDLETLWEKKRPLRDEALMVKSFPETRTFPMRLELAGNYSDDAADFYHRFRVTFYSEEVDYQGIKSRRAKAYVDLRMALESLLKATLCLRSPYSMAGKPLVKAIRAYSHDIGRLQKDALRGIKLDETYSTAVSKCNIAPVDLRYQFDAMNFRVPNDENYYNTIGSTAWLKIIEEFVRMGLQRLQAALGRRSKIVPGSIAMQELKRASDYPSG